MKQLRPINIYADMEVPESDFFADDTMDVPNWTTKQMSKTFFGDTDTGWLRPYLKKGLLQDNDEPIYIPRGASNDYLEWRLIDIERFAHALAHNGFIDIEQLFRVLDQVRIIAETWGYLPARPVPTLIAPHDPTRKGIYAVDSLEEITDDLDGAKGAQTRTIALGDVEYVIDLTDEHWQDVITALSPYLKVARRNTGRSEDTSKRADRAKIRAWARDNGYPVGTRGRIPQTTINAYLIRERS